MKNFKRLALTAASAGILLTGQAQKGEERSVAHFTKISARGEVSVYFRQSDTLSLRVTGDALGGDLRRVVTEVSGGMLTISSGSSDVEDAAVYVSGPELLAVEAAGVAAIYAEAPVTTDAFDISFSGASQGRIAVDAQKVTCVQSGASGLTLSGKCGLLTARIAGASTLKSYGLDAGSVEIETSGAASAQVKAGQRFSGNATGASSIKLRGQPGEVIAESSGSASITRVEPEASGKSDTVVYHLKNKKIIVIGEQKPSKPKVTSKARQFKHWTGISLGVNGYMHPGSGLTLPAAAGYLDLNYAKSYNIQINPLERHFNLARHNCKIVTGLGIDIHRYALSQRTTLNPDSSFVTGVIDSSGIGKYTLNLLRATYLQVPLLIEFNTSNYHKRTFHVAFGVVGQYRIGARTKQKMEVGGYDIERRNKDDYNLNPFAAKAHFNFGYRGWTLFVEYAITPLFRPGKGPELYPFTAGLRVIPFV